MTYLEYAYDAWGKIIAQGNDPLYEQNPFRYRGYYYDEETGFYFLNSRYYDPEVKRFINADCLFVAGDELTGANMYAYCNGNPVMFRDPSGMGPQYSAQPYVDLYWEYYYQYIAAGQTHESADRNANSKAGNICFMRSIIWLLTLPVFSSQVDATGTITNPQAIIDVCYGYSNSLIALLKISFPSLQDPVIELWFLYASDEGALVFRDKYLPWLKDQYASQVVSTIGAIAGSILAVGAMTVAVASGIGTIPALLAIGEYVVFGVGLSGIVIGIDPTFIKQIIDFLQGL